MSDIGLAVYGVYGQVMVDVCVVPLSAHSRAAIWTSECLHCFGGSSCILRSFLSSAFASPTVCLLQRMFRQLGIEGLGMLSVLK